MLHSLHWPEGARFLQDLCAFVRHATTHTSPHNQGRQFGRIGTTLTFAPTATLLVDVQAPLTPNAGSAHARLPAQAFLNTARTALDRFVRTGAALPGLAAHGRVPCLSITLSGTNDPDAGGVSGHMWLAHARFDHTSARRPGQAKDTRIHAQRPLPIAAQDLLDAIDVLCRHAPAKDAPIWVAHRPAGPHRDRLDPIVGPFRANSHADALALVPILAWNTAIDPQDILIFQSPDPGHVTWLPQPVCWR